MKYSCALIALSIVLLASCTKQTTTETVLPSGERKTIHRTAGDTISYVVEFAGKKEKKRFAKDFNSFLSEYSFDTLRTDTINEYFSLRLVPAPDTSKEEEPLDMATVETPVIEEVEIELPPDTAKDEERPQKGGAITMYSDRGFCDKTLAKLIAANPFAVATIRADDNDADEHDGPDSSIGYLLAERIAAKKIKISIVKPIKNAQGKSVAAFDLVTAWTEYIKKNPSEGAAMLYSVKGLAGFIRGEEAVIPGIQIKDAKTIILMLEKNDPDALERLQSPRFMPASLKLGRYYIKKAAKGKWLLAPNRNFIGSEPYLKQLTLVFGNDKNPLVSYSLKRYDIATLVYAKDLEYARRSLLKESVLGAYSHDRYFLALGASSPNLRTYLTHALSRTRILSGIAKTESTPIGAIESDEVAPNKPGGRMGQAPLVNSALSIVYMKQDPLSARIAEKALALLSQQNIPAKLNGLGRSAYQKTLFAKDYDIAVGFVSKDILESKHEKIRLATIWFGNMRDEKARIAKAYEIPLFSVKRHALCRNSIGFYQGKLAGVYVTSEQK